MIIFTVTAAEAISNTDPGQYFTTLCAEILTKLP